MATQRSLPVAIVDRRDDAREIAFWLDRSPDERISAVEVLREHYYVVRGYASTPRLVKELRLVTRST